jgi:hypothetical protein
METTRARSDRELIANSRSAGGKNGQPTEAGCSPLDHGCIQTLHAC